MADGFSPAQRSRIMAAVKSRHTGPELQVRKALHRMGYRYRLDNRHLPGKPDLTFRKQKIAVFVHGCFWHGHDCKRGARIPKTHTDYWRDKITRNRARDQKVQKTLRQAGRRVVILWACRLGHGALEEILEVLEAPSSS